VPLVIIILALLALVIFAGWWFDRTRRREGRAPYVDRRPYRPDFHGESTEFGHMPPTPYIDHPTGGGPPPGVEVAGPEPPPRR
jgi:hypothetical protein